MPKCHWPTYPSDSSGGEAATAAKLLQGVLDQYKDARLAAIALPFLGPKVKGDGRHGKGKKADKAVESVNKTDKNL